MADFYVSQNNRFEIFHIYLFALNESVLIDTLWDVKQLTSAEL